MPRGPGRQGSTRGVRPRYRRGNLPPDPPPSPVPRAPDLPPHARSSAPVALPARSSKPSPARRRTSARTGPVRASAASPAGRNPTRRSGMAGVDGIAATGAGWATAPNRVRSRAPVVPGGVTYRPWDAQVRPGAGGRRPRCPACRHAGTTGAGTARPHRTHAAGVPAHPPAAQRPPRAWRAALDLPSRRSTRRRTGHESTNLPAGRSRAPCPQAAGGGPGAAPGEGMRR